MPWEGDHDGGWRNVGSPKWAEKWGRDWGVILGREGSCEALGGGLQKLGFTNFLVSFLLGTLIWVSAMEQTCFWLYLKALGCQEVGGPGWLPWQQSL
jgi:hypothetical protein